MAKAKNLPTPAELSGFCSEVALMLSSGMALYDGMEALAQTYASDPHADLYRKASQGVTETGSLYEALKADDRWPGYMVEMVGIGERSGRLEEVMNGLTEYYERESRIRRAVVSAVTYPMILGLIMLLIVLIMVLKVVPVFRRVLGSMGLALTASGGTLLRLGTTVGWAVLGVVGAAVLLVLGVVLILKTKKRDGMLAFLRSTFRPIRRLSIRLSSSRVASVLSMMLSGGFPLEDCLELIPGVLNDPFAVNEVNTVREKLNRGVSFSDALNECELFDEIHSRMIRMGVAAGREDEVMAKIASVYEEQVEEGISGLVSIIEPTLVALLSIVIGAILLSVMLPMAGIITSIL